MREIVQIFCPVSPLMFRQFSRRGRYGPLPEVRLASIFAIFRCRDRPLVALAVSPIRPRLRLSVPGQRYFSRLPTSQIFTCPAPALIRKHGRATPTTNRGECGQDITGAMVECGAAGSGQGSGVSDRVKIDGKGNVPNKAARRKTQIRRATGVPQRRLRIPVTCWTSG